MKIYKPQKRKFLDTTIEVYKVDEELYVDNNTIKYILNVSNPHQIQFGYGTGKNIPYNELWQNWSSHRNSFARNNKIDRKEYGYKHTSHKSVIKLTAVYEYLKKSRQDKTIKENKIRELERILEVR